MKDPQLVLGLLSGLFIAIGVIGLLNGQEMWPQCHRYFDGGLKPFESILLCGIGTAGVAFLAWLKR